MLQSSGKNGAHEAKTDMKEKTKNGWKKFGGILRYSVLPVLLSGILNTLAIYMFVQPNGFAPGGTNGIAVLLEYGTNVNSGIYLLALNVPLFFLAFFLFNKRAAIMSTSSMALSSGLLIAFEYIPGIDQIQYQPQGNNLAYGFLAAIASGILLGASLANMIRSCGTSGGTSVIASIVNKRYRHLSVSMLTAAFDACVVIASFFVYYGEGSNFTERLSPVLLALVSLFVTSKMSDIILQGFKTAYKFEIITVHPDEIAQEIMTKLHHGVTRLSGEGMYSHEGKSVLICVIRKRQVATLQKILRPYPDTFAYFTSVSEVYGQFLK